MAVRREAGTADTSIFLDPADLDHIRQLTDTRQQARQRVEAAHLTGHFHMRHVVAIGPGVHRQYIHLLGSHQGADVAQQTGTVEGLNQNRRRVAGCAGLLLPQLDLNQTLRLVSL